MNLHIETLAIAAFVVSLALTFAMTAMRIFLKGQPGLRRWTQALWLVAAATVLFGLRGKVPDVVPVLVGNAFLALAAALTWMGMREFCGLSQDLRPVLGVTAACLAVQALFLWGHPSFEARSINVILTSTIWNLASAWTLYRHGPPDLTSSTRLVSFLFFTDAAIGLGLIVPNLIGARQSDPGLIQATQVTQYLAGLAIGTFEVLGLAVMLNQRLLAELRRVARVDGLTGILNRRGLDAEAPRLLQICQRQRLPCTLLMADLDHFKRFNDTHGHAGGDGALRHFAALVGSQLRASDLFGRYGGEEFCILMPGTQGDLARLAAERLRIHVSANPVPLNGALLPLTVSLGLAVYDGNGSADFAALLDQADQGLYRAKALGRNRVEVRVPPPSFRPDLLQEGAGGGLQVRGREG